MSKMFQIYEDDLADLEKTIPELMDALSLLIDNRLKVKIRRIQHILSNVRWNYGPYTSINIEEDYDGHELLS